MAFNAKNEVLVRVYIVLVGVVMVAIAIFAQAIKISIIEGDKWRSKGEELYIREVPLEAERGNILTEDGSLLATSMPFYNIGFDPNSSAIDSASWNANIDSLAYCIATFINPEYTPGGMKEFLQAQRDAGKRYILLKKDATLEEKELMSTFPLFNLGQFRGGFIANQHYRRERPFRILANRTIGYTSGDTISVGLEGFFDEYLRGEAGTQLMYRVGDGMWIPINDLTKIEPRSGKDVVTTIDINLQDITENALAKAMIRHQAEYGTAILIDVKSGAIKAVANLGWTREGQLWEIYNYAIGTATEPGSTFKLASVMALLEDGYINPNDSVDLEQGRTQYFESELQDAYPHTLNNVTIKQAFEMSSNVGISKLVYENYGTKNRAERYIQRLNDFYLTVPTGIEMNGEPTPFVKRPYSSEDGWSGTTLPWMAMGYELTVTPLQLLAFYNAVANDGVYVKPFMVREIQKYGITTKKFPVTEIKGRIASKKTIKHVKSMMEGVVDSVWGTAYSLRSSAYKFAGKTGTAQLGYQRLENKTQVKGYQASFAGYFPADNPVYSCLVLISKPKEAGYYGGQVALPVFREIADKAMATEVELYPVVNASKKLPLESRLMPSYDAGYMPDLRRILKELRVDYVNRSEGDWAVLKAVAPDSLKMMRLPVGDRTVPNVLGMGLRDAIYLMENKGLRVRVNGSYGKVRQQSIRPGTRAGGQTVVLRVG